MNIKTQYGSIEYDDLDDFELSKKTLDFLKKQREAVELFFGDEIDLTDYDTTFNDEITELAEVAIAENKFSEPERAFAIAEYTEKELNDIEESNHDEKLFDVDSEEYLVLTDEEADEEAKTRAKDLLDDIGIDGLSDNVKDHIYQNFVTTDWFDDAMKELNDSYAYDIKDEASSDSDMYVSRLHEEMVERGVMEEPEWPSEDDFEEDDDAFEDATSDYRSELESEVEDKIDEFVEALNGDYENGLEYYQQNFGSEEVAEIVKNNDLLDMDAIAEYIIEFDGRGYTISPDYGEDSITIKYRNKDYEFYIYKH